MTRVTSANAKDSRLPPGHPHDTTISELDSDAWTTGPDDAEMPAISQLTDEGQGSFLIGRFFGTAHP